MRICSCVQISHGRYLRPSAGWLAGLMAPRVLQGLDLDLNLSLPAVSGSAVLSVYLLTQQRGREPCRAAAARSGSGCEEQLRSRSEVEQKKRRRREMLQVEPADQEDGS